MKNIDKSSALKPAPKETNLSSKSYKETLSQAQSHMNPWSRAFSRIVHIRALDILNGILASTIFRPIPILTASLFATILPLIIWLIAKHYGYSFSGSESIVCFALGLLVGYVIDYTKILATGRSR